jgi:hypothetical protein
LEQPAPVAVGEWMDVEISLNPIAQCVPAGHRIRLSVSTQAWPLVWPAARNMTLELLTGQSSLSLPLLDAERIESLTPAPLADAAIPESLALTWTRPVKRERTIEIDEVTGMISRSYIKDDGAYHIEEHGMEIDASGCLTYRTRGEDPLTAEADYSYQINLARGDWQVGVECEVRVTADAENFFIKGEYRAIEKGRLVRRRAIDIPIKREFV